MARPGKPADCASSSYSVEVLREWLEKLTPVVEFDLNAYVECDPDLSDGVSEDHNLNDDGEFRIKCGPDGDTPVVQPHHVEDFAEAYESGRLTERSRLRLSHWTWFYVTAVSERAWALEHVRNWSQDTLAIYDASGADERDWGVWIERGLTPFAFGLLKKGGLHDDAVPCYSEQDFFVVVQHEKDADDSGIDDVVTRYLCELAARFDVVLKRSNYIEWLEELPNPPCVGTKTLVAAYGDGDWGVRSLPTGSGASELAALWLRGSQVEDAASAVVAYTRVIEFVSATASRTDSHSRLRMLLDLDEAVSASASFLDRILSESEEYVRVNKADKELLRITIQKTCVPSILADHLNSVSPDIVKKLRSSTDGDRRAGLADFARTLYATRNSLVHAKTTYSATGREVSESRLEEFVPAVRQAALMAMRWFLQQPSHVRVV